MTATPRIDLLGMLRKAGLAPDTDCLRAGVRVLTPALMDTEVSAHPNAERHERTAGCTGQRNGYRARPWDTRVGTSDVQSPRVRDGSSFPAVLEPRKRAARALVAVVQEADVQGVSTRRVDDLVQPRGLAGSSKSPVSRSCQEVDAEVARFRSRRLAGPYPSMWLAASYLKVRQDGRVVAMAVVIAIGVRASGERAVLGLAVGASEDGAFWLRFLRGLVARGLGGVQLVISAAHEGPRGVVAAVMTGARWQRCRVHTMRTQSGIGRCWPRRSLPRAA